MFPRFTGIIRETNKPLFSYILIEFYLYIVSNSFLLLVVRPLLLVAMPGAPSSVLAPSMKLLGLVFSTTYKATSKCFKTVVTPLLLSMAMMRLRSQPISIGNLHSMRAIEVTKYPIPMVRAVARTSSPHKTRESQHIKAKGFLSSGIQVTLFPRKPLAPVSQSRHFGCFCKVLISPWTRTFPGTR